LHALFPYPRLWYIICIVWNKCLCSLSMCSWMCYAQRHIIIHVHVIVVLMLVVLLKSVWYSQDGVSFQSMRSFAIV
jgi:hypothetical protein